MKKRLSLIFSVIAAFVLFSSCDDKENTLDEQWKINNETQFAKITANTEYKRINATSTSGYIMYKELQSGDGETPYFSDRVSILYTGWYKNDWLQEKDSYTDNQGNTIINKIIFDSTENRNDIPSTFSVNPAASNGIIEGLSTALQHMQVGDKWEVWIPWMLGYGSRQQSNIPPYTTLVFEVELVSILK